MGGRQITFLVFISFVMGSIIGFLGIHKLSQNSATSKTFKTLGELSDLDFLSKYHEQKDELSPVEKAMGDRLFACLESQQKNTQKKIKNAESQLSEPSHTKTFIDQAPIQKNFPEGNLSLYAKAGQNLAPLHIMGGTFLKLFPNQTFALHNEENAGLENGPLKDTKTYLQKHLCIDPSFSVMTEEQRNRTKFFDVVRDDTFKGTTLISTGTTSNSLTTKMQFNSSTHQGFDYIETSDGKQNMVEKRLIESEGTNEAWRYNSCQPSIVLLSDRCPWNDRFSQEFKDFFVSPESKKLVGNIYCKNPADARWTNLGTFELNQSADDQE